MISGSVVVMLREKGGVQERIISMGVILCMIRLLTEDKGPKINNTMYYNNNIIYEGLCKNYSNNVMDQCKVSVYCIILLITD